VTVHEVSPLFRSNSQQSRTTDTGAVDTEAEALDAMTKPVRSVSLFNAYILPSSYFILIL